MQVRPSFQPRLMRAWPICLILLAGCERADQPDVHSELTGAADPAEVNAADSLQQDLNGTRFVSVDKLEIGLGQDGPELGFWYLTFHDGIVTWDYSDMQQSTEFTVAADGTITANFPAQTVTGTLNPDSGNLHWDNRWYQPVPPGADDQR